MTRSCSFKSRPDSELFLSYFNCRHSNINFTLEHEVDKRLFYSDCMVQRCSNKFISSVHRKPTFSVLGISFLSFLLSDLKSNPYRLCFSMPIICPLTIISCSLSLISWGFLSLTMGFLSILLSLKSVSFCPNVFPIQFLHLYSLFCLSIW